MLINETDKKRELNQDGESLSLKSEDRYRMPSNQGYAIDWFIKKNLYPIFFSCFLSVTAKFPDKEQFLPGSRYVFLSHRKVSL